MLKAQGDTVTVEYCRYTGDWDAPKVKEQITLNIREQIVEGYQKEDLLAILDDVEDYMRDLSRKSWSCERIERPIFIKWYRECQVQAEYINNLLEIV